MLASDEVRIDMEKILSIADFYGEKFKKSAEAIFFFRDKKTETLLIQRHAMTPAMVSLSVPNL